MRTLKAALGLIFLLATFGAAQAGGSISLTDLMDRLKDNEKLIAEINAELKAQKLEADERHLHRRSLRRPLDGAGRGARVPYECEIGTRKLNIDGTLHLYDAKGAEIDEGDENAPERAFDHKETDITWTWK